MVTRVMVFDRRIPTDTVKHLSWKKYMAHTEQEAEKPTTGKGAGFSGLHHVPIRMKNCQGCGLNKKKITLKQLPNIL